MHMERGTTVDYSLIKYDEVKEAMILAVMDAILAIAQRSFQEKVRTSMGFEPVIS